MFCLNVPETFYAMYGLNDFGMVTEWFNPLATSVSLLREHIKKNNVKTLVIIDMMYPVVKEAIKDTSVEHIIVTSVLDSFPTGKKLLYKCQVFGFNRLIQSTPYKYLINKIKGIAPDERDISPLHSTTSRAHQKLNAFQKFVSKIDAYVQKEKIYAKASFYCDSPKDARFIAWKDFVNKYGETSTTRRVPYQEGKTTIIVHTGGTTGPAKPITHSDYAINSAVYQTSIMPLGIAHLDTFCQLVPPIVAYSLENMHFTRFMQMNTFLIATYNRNEFPKIVLKTRANHYNVVPSFAKALISSEKVAHQDLSFVKSCQYGGEGISPEDDAAIDKLLNGRGRHGFGQNEEFGVFTGNYDVPGVEKVYGCCGFPMYGNGYIVIDRETGEELPYGRDSHGNYYIGDLCVCGPTIMKGYIREAASENSITIIFRNGIKYIKTGDQAYIDEEGRLWYWTREQRIIRTQQGKIFTNIIETILNDIPEIIECCVVKCPHPYNVAEAACHIVLKPECWQNGVDAIIECIVQTVERATQEMYSYYVPGTYEFRKERLPTTSFGKVDFRKLEQENKALYRANSEFIGEENQN